MQYVMIVFVAFFALRLFSLYFSIRNEKRLVRRGAIQYGKFNSLLLALAHVAYYFSALYEAYAADVEFEKTSGVGVAVMLFAYVMLFYVIYKLRDVWTVKLYILRAVIAHFFKLCLASYNMYLTALTSPGREWSSPISVS